MLMIEFVHFVKKNLRKRNRIFFVLMSTFVINVLVVIIPLLQKELIDKATKLEMDFLLIFTLVLLTIFLSCSYIVETLILNNISNDFKHQIEMKLVEAVVRKDSKTLEVKGPGGYMVGIFGNSEQISMLLHTNYFSILVSIMTSIVILILTLSWTKYFFLTVIISYTVMISLIIVIDKRYAKSFKSGREEVFKLNPLVLEHIENRESIKHYGNVEVLEKKLEDKFLERDSHFKKSFALNSLGGMSINIIQSISFAIFFSFSIFEVIEGKVEVSTLVALIAFFPRVFAPIGGIQKIMNDMNRFKMLKKRVEEDLESEVKYQLPENNRIKFENCSFSYKEGKGINGIKDFDLEIDKSYGLVGLSGEGKSTIIKLLIGNKEVEDGRITYGEKNIKKLTEYISRTGISYYSQEAQIFNRSIDYNINLGKKGLSLLEYEQMIVERKGFLESILNKIFLDNRLEVEEEKLLKKIFMISKMDKIKNHIEKIKLELNGSINIEDIAKLSISREFFIKERYEELYRKLNLEKLEGRELGQRGNKISGGEKNRIALARFLLPRDFHIFIIDEPFISLDLLAEKESLELLKEYLKGKKGIIISHKLRVIEEMSEEVIVIDEGKISQRGHIDKLKKENYLLKKLYTEHNKGVL